MTHHASHNPLGALMVYAIWGTLLVIVGSGVAMSGPPPADPAAVSREHDEDREHGARADEDDGDDRHGEEREDDEEEGPLGELHEISVNLLYVLIALHLMGVVFETRRSGPQIVRAMLPGGNRD
ncbi:MAG: cytochrome b/b6 domain-containing protein [Sphingomonadaceae bacterium]